MNPHLLPPHPMGSLASGARCHRGRPAVAAWLCESNCSPFARWLFVGLATLFLLPGASFRHLAVEDQGDHLDIYFGPLPLFRRRVSIREHAGCRGRQDGAAGKLGHSHESPRRLGLEHLGA